MRQLIILSLAVLLTLAGCSATPFVDPTPQQKPAPVKLVNNETITETFEVAVVPVGANLTVTRRYGQTFNQTIGQGSSTTITTTDNKDVKVEFPDSARLHGRYTLVPGEQKLLSVEGVAPDEAIVILVYDEPEQAYRAIKSLSCSGPIHGYRVQTRAGGHDDWTPSTHQCGF